MTSAQPTNLERGIMPLVVFAAVTGVVSVALDIWQDLSGVAAGVIPLAAFGPALGALVAWIAFRGRLGELLPAPVARRQVVAHLVLGLVASAVLVGFMIVALALFFGSEGRWVSLDEVESVTPNSAQLAILVMGVIVAASLQELGIRGLAQPILELSGSRLLATLIIGFVWGFWVVQLFPMENSPLAVGATLLATVALSVLLGYLGNGSVAQRLAVTIPVHAIIAIAITVLAVNAVWSVETGAGAIRAGDGWPGAGWQLGEGLALSLLVASVVTTALFMLMFVIARRRRARRAAVA